MDASSHEREDEWGKLAQRLTLELAVQRTPAVPNAVAWDHGTVTSADTFCSPAAGIARASFGATLPFMGAPLQGGGGIHSAQESATGGVPPLPIGQKAASLAVGAHSSAFTGGISSSWEVSNRTVPSPADLHVLAVTQQLAAYTQQMSQLALAAAARRSVAAAAPELKDDAVDGSPDSKSCDEMEHTDDEESNGEAAFSLLNLMSHRDNLKQAQPSPEADVDLQEKPTPMGKPPLTQQEYFRLRRRQSASDDVDSSAPASMTEQDFFNLRRRQVSSDDMDSSVISAFSSRRQPAPAQPAAASSQVDALDVSDDNATGRKSLSSGSSRSRTCKICSKSFLGRMDLVRHMRVHTGERPYVCPECNKTFAQQGTLSCHMRIHTGEMPFECPTCRSRFRHSSNMRRHARSCKVRASRRKLSGINSGDVTPSTSAVSSENHSSIPGAVRKSQSTPCIRVNLDSQT